MKASTKETGGTKRATSAMRWVSGRRRTLYAVAAIALLVAVFALTAGSDDPAGWFGLGDDGSTSLVTTETVETSSTARNDASAATTATDEAPPSGGSDAAGDEPAHSADESAAPPPGGDLSYNAVSQIDIPEFELPQTYETVVTVVGWASEAAGTVYVEIESARLMGAIDPMTGDETGPPEDPSLDQSARFRELVILATTNDGVRGALVADRSASVRLVLIPAGDGAVFRIDRLAD